MESGHYTIRSYGCLMFNYRDWDIQKASQVRPQENRSILESGRLQLKCDDTRWRREGKWSGNWRMEWVASTLHTTSKRGVSSITTADAHTSAASSRLNWSPLRFKWTRPFRRKTKSGFLECAITFQLDPTHIHKLRELMSSQLCPQYYCVVVCNFVCIYGRKVLCVTVREITELGSTITLIFLII